MPSNGSRRSLAPGAPALALALALAACHDDRATAGAQGASDVRPDREWTDAARVEAVASALQACSYDGSPAKVGPGQLNGQAPADCRAMVEKIMGYTGLPANFVVTAGPVPNALAVILLDRQKIPQRVIAFNPDFIDATERLTGGDRWAPMSIMAHEIGHHLSGHTITSGGSRPEIELEADKFSGFVLYKMGAPLADATKAMAVIGSEHEQATHPAKTRRIAAISQGWQEACRQAGGSGCAAGAVVASAQAAPATGTPAAMPGTAPPASTTSAAPTGAGTATGDATIAAGDIDGAAPAGTPAPATAQAHARLPAPSSKAIPFKYGRFVVDETGKLDQAQLTALDQKLYALAKDKGVEFAVLFVDDLHGMTPDDYAWAMMRQLRIGKLDLGNGGVIVIAPAQGVSGGAFAPGVAKKLEFFDPGKRFDGTFRIIGWERNCLGGGDCRSFTSGLTDVVGTALKDLDTKWEIRFDSIEDAIAHSIATERQRAAARKAGRQPDYDHADSPIGALARFTATVTDVAPKPGPVNPQGPEDLRVNRWTVTEGGYKAVLVKTDSGQETTLYMQPQTPTLMPSGALQVGKQYTFVGEIKSAGRFHTDQGVVQINPGVWLFSYEAL